MSGLGIGLCYETWQSIQTGLSVPHYDLEQWLWMKASKIMSKDLFVKVT